jgi:hypothetical protein
MGFAETALGTYKRRFTAAPELNMDNKSRQELTDLIEEDNVRNGAWWNPKEFEEQVRSRLPTQLRIISVPPNMAGNFNCFVYTLGLQQDREFWGGNNPVQQEFIKYLLTKDVLSKTDIPESDDLIFYKDEDGNITHGGIVKSGSTILSKWMWGALFEHEIWDVPSSFGDEVFYCKPISLVKAKKEYIDYKNSGIEIKPIG